MQKTIALFLFTFALAFLPLGARAVTVGPVRLEYSADPGETLQGTMFLVNEGDATQTFYPSFERFTEDNGQKVFTKETSDLATWFTMSTSETLKAGEQRVIPFTVKIPADAAPGGHFAVIWWSTTPPGESGKQVAIVTRAGVLVYLTISGNIQESGNVVDLSPSVPHNIAIALPINFSVLFKNTGNVSLKPIGSLTIRNMLGMTTAVIPVNPDQGAILPQSRKSFSAAWDDHAWHFGLYHASLDMAYGTATLHANGSTWIAVFSWQGIAIALLIILLLFILPKAIRRYNRWVVRRMSGTL